MRGFEGYQYKRGAMQWEVEDIRRMKIAPEPEGTDYCDRENGIREDDFKEKQCDDVPSIECDHALRPKASL